MVIGFRAGPSQSLDADGVDEDGGLNGVKRGSDGEKVGCMKSTARKNDSCAGRFKVLKSKLIGLKKASRMLTGLDL